MIAEAFRKEGILVGFYYSPGDFRYQLVTGQRTGHIYEPGFDSGRPCSARSRRSFLDYERGQIEELLTRYGDIFMLWFDGKCDPLKKHAWRVRQDVFIGRGEIPTPGAGDPREGRRPGLGELHDDELSVVVPPRRGRPHVGRGHPEPHPHPGPRRQHAPQHRAPARRPDRPGRRGSPPRTRPMDDALRRGGPRRPALERHERGRCLAHPAAGRRDGLRLAPILDERQGSPDPSPSSRSTPHRRPR